MLIKKILPALILGSVLFSCKEGSKTKGTTKMEAAAPKLELIAEVKGLAHCESVVFDTKRNVLYVSVQGENEPNDGSIAKVSLDGEILVANFVQGLNDPKGIALLVDKLYVSDGKELVEADLNTGGVLQKYPGKDAEFLNDVAVDKDGNVYVSDMATSSIYKLDTKGNFENWLTSDDLEDPNGLLIDHNTLYIAAWGKRNSGNTTSNPKGRLLKLDIPNKKITPITAEPLGNLDGLQTYDNSSFLVSDWSTGSLYKISKGGTVSPFFTAEPSVGDIMYLPSKHLLGLPMNKQSKLLLYRVTVK
ncbi:hypothetical protein K8352_01230 [Flavobacteriaceae bacterium F89]|uniref:SMP-30/Gluconolactonase/LRE-like region domain-containing protein n=1 Tax=Cerina litoralis TaxID=2874477 RepID=A0AAE3EQP6_9FLAO|nr:hypothetical protein [Cerina litoralis]MCG2459365.1 hypothetical protein [Cerina litoralis]